MAVFELWNNSSSIIDRYFNLSGILPRITFMYICQIAGHSFVYITS